MSLITAEQKTELEAAGYVIENMGRLFGSGFAGEYRWINERIPAFQDCETSDSEDNAWVEALSFHKEMQEDKALLPDLPLSAEQLDEKYNPDGDGEHPTIPRSAWREAVANEDTVSGYWAWVHHQIVTRTESKNFG